MQDLLTATSTGAADAAVAAITVTAARTRTSDFTQPFYETGLGVAVAGGMANWLPVLRTFLSFSFLQAILILLGIALIVGALVWLFERRKNDHFGGHPVRGLTSGIWWSAVAMTQAGAAQGGPATLPGRLLAVVWMIVSIIALAVFTAGITSSYHDTSIAGSRTKCRRSPLTPCRCNRRHLLGGLPRPSASRSSRLCRCLGGVERCSSRRSRRARLRPAVVVLDRAPGLPRITGPGSDV